MKKSISLLVIVSILATVFSGCSFNRISAEEDIINMQVGGYLYTSQAQVGSKDERAFLKEREKAVKSMLVYLDKTAGYSFDVISSFSKYEDNLMDYIKKIKDPSVEHLKIINIILEKMTAYKVILGATQNEVQQYMKMKPADEANKAIINSYFFDGVCRLVSIENEYLSWLLNNTASVRIILEQNSERHAEKLIDTSENIYENNIRKKFVDMLLAYEAAAVINSTILSADYYVSGIYLDQAENNLEILASGKTDTDVSAAELSELMELLSIARNSISIPIELKPLPNDSVSFFTARKVSAEGEGTHGFESSTSLLQSYSDPEPITSNEIETKDFIAEINTKSDQSRIAPKTMTESAEEKPAPYAKLTKDEKSAEEIAKEEAGKRSMAILAIEIAQEKIKLGVTFPWEEELTPYEQIIEKISDMLVNGENKLSDTEKQDAVNLIKDNMEILLGGNKDQFLLIILESEAAELYDNFMIWKDNIKNIKTHNFTKVDLMNLLDAMGVSISDDIINSVNAEKPTQAPVLATPAPIASPSTTPAITSNPTVSTPVPSAPVSNPDSSDIWTPSRDNLGIYDVFHINASHFIFKDIDIFTDNASLLFSIYGWVDPINYSNYQCIETTKMDGSLLDLLYIDSDENRIGWALRIGDNSMLTYTYHFPGENAKTLVIKRIGTLEKSYILSINSEDKTIDRLSSIYFYKPDDEDIFRVVEGLFEKQDGNKVGLNLTGSSFNYTYEYRDNDKFMDSFQYNRGILIREIHNEYSGDDKYTNEKSYFDSGILMTDYNTLNNSPEGIQKTYYENKYMQSTTEFKDGEKNGIEKRYFDSGRLSVLETYVMGKKEGPYEKYYNNDTHQLHMKGAYSQDKQSGTWYIYNEVGNLQDEITY